MTDKRISTKEMLDELDRYNLDFIKFKLKDEKDYSTIRKLYNAVTHDDTRITMSDDLYVLYTDIAKGDLNELRSVLDYFLENRDLRVYRHNDIETLIEHLDQESEKPENLGNIKSINGLRKKLAEYDKELVDNLQRSGIFSFSKEELETMKKFLRNDSADV